MTDAGGALEPSDDNSGGSLFEMGDSGLQRGSASFGQLGPDRDRSSQLFDMGADSDGDSGPSAFDRLGDDDDSSAQERLNRLSEADDSEDLYG